jgi:hypothetical protein
MERLGIDMNAKDSNGQPLVADTALARRELTFDWQVATRALAWAHGAGKYVIWSDPALYVPYECYLSPAEVLTATKSRDDYIEGEARLAVRYANLVPVYGNNEGLKRCGVAYGDWSMTPRNFRLVGWERIPSEIASLKHGATSLASSQGFGLSVQSWTSDYDPILSAGTLPPQEIAIWTLDGLAKGASLIGFEPYFYFFAWPASAGIPPSAQLAHDQQLGDARPALHVLFAALGIEDPR